MRQNFCWREHILIDGNEFIICDTRHHGDMYGHLEMVTYGIRAIFDDWPHPKNRGFHRSDPVEAIIDLLDYSGRWLPPKPNV